MKQSPMEGWSVISQPAGVQPLAVLPELWTEECLATRDGSNWTKRFSHPVGEDALVAVCSELILYAESVGARLGGFSPTKNPHFRGRKFRPLGMISPLLYVIRQDGKGDPEWPFFRLLTEHLVRVGRVALCNWIYLPSPHYSYGTPLQQKQTYDRYPGLFSGPISKALKTYDPEEFDSLRKEYLTR